jgi:hypothetical protein
MSSKKTLTRRSALAFRCKSEAIQKTLDNIHRYLMGRKIIGACYRIVDAGEPQIVLETEFEEELLDEAEAAKILGLPLRNVEAWKLVWPMTRNTLLQNLALRLGQDSLD